MSQLGPKIVLNPFIYPDLTQPNGPLPKDMRAQACWYFYLIAHEAYDLVGDGASTQIIYDDELWMDKRYEQQARSVAVLYGLDSPSEFAKFWPYVITCAQWLGMPSPLNEYMNPIIGRIIV